MRQSSKSPFGLFLRAFKYAGRGVWHCVVRERNFRFHLCACAYAAYFLRFFSPTRAETAVVILLCGLVLALEGVNSAVERAVDCATSEYSKFAELAKDIAAGSVLIGAATAVAAGVAMFGRSELLLPVVEYHLVPHRLVLLLLSAAAAVLFVFAVPTKKSTN
jgi:diacylglycerol kinase